MKSKKTNHGLHFRAFGPGAAALLLGVLLCASCGGPSRPKAAERADTLRTYDIPRPPAVMTDPQTRAAYVAENV